MSETVKIPQPKTYGPLGHLPLIDKNNPTMSMCKLAEEYGPIYRLTFLGQSSLVLSGHELVADVCDESRFDKAVYHELENVRAFSGDGLFTSRTDEPNWKKAHNILLPTFSQQAMKGYHSMMVDIASQLIQKWARLNPNESIDVPDDMTRLTLDTIGLCGFNYRFNSYYKESHSPFIISMVRALNEAMLQSSRLKIQTFLMFGTRRQYEEDIQTMFSLVDKIIEERKANGDQGEIDLLARMLNGKDPETGEGLDNENIRYQIITFLIAGHETTSGLLSFAIYFLLKNPDVLQKAYEEVDRVLPSPTPTYQQVVQLKYIRMILNESLRLWPTAPGFELYAKEDTLIAGKYPIKKGETVGVLLPQLHRDKNAWGEDAERFRPERFEDPSKIPNHAYKPFGNGQRACIGMQFALHEATLVLGMILQHFELIDHTNYQLDVKQTLTIKPGDFHIRVKARNTQHSTSFLPDTQNNDRTTQVESKHTSVYASAHNTPLLVLYGSNLGTAEGIARELAETGRMQGFKSEVAPLNDRLGKLPTEGAVIIVTSSYNGKPPSNAREFVKWLESADDGSLQGVQYAVFGCGDRNWASTYQDVPRFIDEQLALKGAVTISERGEADASEDSEKQLEQWRERLWTDIRNAFNLASNDALSSIADQDRNTLHVQFVSDLETVPLALAYGADYAFVQDNRELQMAHSDRSTRHIEIKLPVGVTYQEGDHLGILPSNSNETINRILRRFGLNGREQLVITAMGQQAAHLPLERPVCVYDLLRQSVEVQEAATRAQLRELAAYTMCPPHKRELEAMLEENVYEEQVRKKRVSMLDLLEKYEACELSFEKFLELLPPLKPRYYSISSSPRVEPEQVSITVAVVRDLD